MSTSQRVKIRKNSLTENLYLDRQGALGAVERCRMVRQRPGRRAFCQEAWHQGLRPFRLRKLLWQALTPTMAETAEQSN